MTQQRTLIDRIRHDNGVLLRHATTVARRQDHATDPARSLTAVSFLPQAFAAAVAERLIAPLRAAAPEHYHYPRSSLHTTVRNVRTAVWPPTFGAAEIAQAEHVFRQCTASAGRIEVSFEELMLFPNSVSLIGYGNDAFGELVNKIGRALEQADLADDKRYLSDAIFFGNITIGRFTSAPTAYFQDLVTSLRHEVQWRLHIERIDLISCNPSCAPDTVHRHHSYPLA